MAALDDLHVGGRDGGVDVGVGHGLVAPFGLLVSLGVVFWGAFYVLSILL